MSVIVGALAALAIAGQVLLLKDTRRPASGFLAKDVFSGVD